MVGKVLLGARGQKAALVALVTVLTVAVPLGITEDILAVFVCGSWWRRGRDGLSFHVPNLFEAGEDLIGGHAAVIQLAHQVDLVNSKFEVLVASGGHFG